MHYMSTLVFQNLSETTTTTIKLKLAAPPPEKSNKLLPNEFENRACFDFLQTTPKESGGYFYPCPKQSSFPSLSAKSLELCTENLGSETGSDASSDDGAAAAAAIFSTASAPPSIPSPNSTPFRNSNWKHITRFPKYSDHEFPPPLTSSLQVRRRREGGRLIIEAVEAPFRNSYLQAERSDGRLRISRLD